MHQAPPGAGVQNSQASDASAISGRESDVRKAPLRK